MAGQPAAGPHLWSSSDRKKQGIQYYGGAYALLGASVSGHFWEVIGIQPALGRAFTHQDDKPHSPPVAIISYAAWQRIFAGNSAAVNQQVMLDGKSTAIIGVLPPGLEYPSKVEVWTPAQFEPRRC